jgi:hypothetical protein
LITARPSAFGVNENSAEPTGSPSTAIPTRSALLVGFDRSVVSSPGNNTARSSGSTIIDRNVSMSTAHVRLLPALNVPSDIWFTTRRPVMRS